MTIAVAETVDAITKIDAVTEAVDALNLNSGDVNAILKLVMPLLEMLMLFCSCTIAEAVAIIEAV